MGKMKNQQLKQELEEIVKAELNKGKFDGIAYVEEFNKEPCFSGAIDIRSKMIMIHFNPKYEQENSGRTKSIVEDIARHEINHKGYYGFKGCPRNVENHAKLFIEPMAKILKKKGYGMNDIHYMANALQDTILHTDLAKEFELDGIVDFFDDVGKHNNNKYTEFYEAHVKLNMYLWSNKNQKKKLSKYYSHSDKVKEVLQNFLKRTRIASLKQHIYVNGKKIEVKDRQAIRQFLNDEKNWPRIARIYAEEFSKLIKPGYVLPLPDYGGGDPAKEGNTFDREMYEEEFKRKRMNEAYENDEGIPPWIDSFEALDIVYQNLAKKLNIKVETFTQQTSMPIYYYGKRPFDPDRDKLKHVTFGFDDEGKVEIKKKRWHEDMPLTYKIHEKGFPEIRFCLIDTSGSMLEDPEGGHNIGRKSVIPWGDNSKYHYALLAWYGLLEYLKQNYLLKQTTISLANFSNKTLVGEGLTEAKKIALRPQFGDTYIELDKIKKLFKNKGMLIFTVSDGEIFNWEKIKDEFIKYAKQHYYFHLQIGKKNKTTEDLEKAGLKVEYIKNARDLATKVIDLTDKLYRKNK